MIPEALKKVKVSIFAFIRLFREKGYLPLKRDTLLSLCWHWITLNFPHSTSSSKLVFLITFLLIVLVFQTSKCITHYSNTTNNKITTLQRNQGIISEYIMAILKTPLHNGSGRFNNTEMGVRAAERGRNDTQIRTDSIQ